MSYDIKSPYFITVKFHRHSSENFILRATVSHPAPFENKPDYCKPHPHFFTVKDVEQETNTA